MGRFTEKTQRYCSHCKKLADFTPHGKICIACKALYNAKARQDAKAAVKRRKTVLQEVRQYLAEDEQLAKAEGGKFFSDQRAWKVKFCSECHELCSFPCFTSNTRARFGLSYKCRDCAQDAAKPKQQKRCVYCTVVKTLRQFANSSTDRCRACDRWFGSYQESELDPLYAETLAYLRAEYAARRAVKEQSPSF